MSRCRLQPTSDGKNIVQIQHSFEETGGYYSPNESNNRCNRWFAAALRQRLH